MTLDEIFNTPGKVLQKGVATHFWGGSFTYNRSSIVGRIAALTLTLGVNGPLRRYSGSF